MTTEGSSTSLVDVSSVLVVDGHRVFAELLAHRLRRESAFEHAQVACTLDQARTAVGQRAPDVVLLDPHLEGGSGLDLVADLRSLGSEPRVVVLADHRQRSAFGLDPDAFGWVSKDSPFDDLLQAIEAVRRGEHPTLPAEQDDTGSHALTTPAGGTTPLVPTSRDGHVDDGDRVLTPALTPRQAEVLQCLVTGMTRAEVAVRLRLSPHTVRDHVRHLFRIAAVTSTADLVSWATADQGTRPRRLWVVPSP